MIFRKPYLWGSWLWQGWAVAVPDPALLSAPNASFCPNHRRTSARLWWRRSGSGSEAAGGHLSWKSSQLRPTACWWCREDNSPEAACCPARTRKQAINQTAAVRFSTTHQSRLHAKLLWFDEPQRPFAAPPPIETERLILRCQIIKHGSYLSTLVPAIKSFKKLWIFSGGSLVLTSVSCSSGSGWVSWLWNSRTVLKYSRTFWQGTVKENIKKWGWNSPKITKQQFFSKYLPMCVSLHSHFQDFALTGLNSVLFLVEKRRH